MKIFVSYSRSSPEHIRLVAALAAELRTHFAVTIDNDVTAPHGPDEGWPKWMKRSIKESDWVLMVFDEVYRRRFDGDEDPAIGHGATWEGAIITQRYYRDSGKNRKFIPVLPDGETDGVIPDELYGYNRYRIPAQTQQLISAIQRAGKQDLDASAVRVEKVPAPEAVASGPGNAGSPPATPHKQRAEVWYRRTGQWRKIISSVTTIAGVALIAACLIIWGFYVRLDPSNTGRNNLTNAPAANTSTNTATTPNDAAPYPLAAANIANQTSSSSPNIVLNATSNLVSPSPKHAAVPASSLMTNEVIVWDADSKLVWAKDSFCLGLTEDLLAASRTRKETPGQNLAAIERAAQALRIGGISGWRIATAAEIDALKQVDGSAIFRAFTRHRIRGGALNVIGIYKGLAGRVSAWGYQYANYLSGPYTQNLETSSNNEYGVWLTAGTFEPSDHSALKSVSAAPEQRTVANLTPADWGLLAKTGAVTQAKSLDLTVSVTSSPSAETRAEFVYNLADLGRGGFVASSITFGTVHLSGEGTPEVLIYQTDAEALSWEPDLRQNQERILSNSIPATLPEHIMRNFFTSKSWIAVHVRMNGHGKATFEVPNLAITYIKEVDKLVRN